MVCLDEYDCELVLFFDFCLFLFGTVCLELTCSSRLLAVSRRCVVWYGAFDRLRPPFFVSSCLSFYCDSFGFSFSSLFSLVGLLLFVYSE